MLSRNWNMGVRITRSLSSWTHNIVKRCYKNIPTSYSSTTPLFSAGSAFVHAMTSQYTNIHQTENGSNTHISTLDPRLDLFSQLVPTLERDNAFQLFSASWAHSPIDTLKLIFHAGSVREGKADKSSFQHGLWWLSQNHPRTLLANLHLVPSISYWKDLLELLRRLNIGEEEYAIGYDRRKRVSLRNTEQAKKTRRAEFVKYLASLPNDEARVQAKLEKAEKHTLETQELIKKARELRRELANKRRAHTEARTYDPFYSQVADTVAQLFADQIKMDTELLKQEKRGGITLCGKWAPSFGLCFDKVTGISGLILQKLQQNEPISAETRVNSITLDRYLIPLRRHISSPERFMSANKWDELPYERVPSVATKSRWIQNF
eukprot:TRINITY_DN4147_c0_g1_i4.p1 TRINITY_DN4147_c0_g1~~TRINITY_DN4147_c0_g1_i4.p1  ORF type:complete len:377 (+),score=61.04 TRINITY_DN4147_c0_g1_i4:99-1229(+)